MAFAWLLDVRRAARRADEMRRVCYAGRVARRYAAAFAIWTALGLFLWSQDLARASYFGDPTPWWHTLVTWLVGAWVDALATPWVFAFADRFPIERAHWLRNVALHVVASFAFAIASLAVAA